MSSDEFQTLRNEAKAKDKKIKGLESELAVKAKQTEYLGSEVIDAQKKEPKPLQAKGHRERQLADMVEMADASKKLKSNGCDIEEIRKNAELENENERLMKKQGGLVGKLKGKRRDIEAVIARRAEIEEAKRMAALEDSGLGRQGESGSV